MRYAVLLRGINLGAKRRVAMPALRSALEEAGYEDVATLVQSGNVVLTTSARPKALVTDLEALLADRFGFAIAVVVRTRAELSKVVEGNPFGDVADDPKLLQVSFLSGKPRAAGVKELEEADVAPERVVVRGREVYAWHPDGIGRSDLAKLITAKRLGVEVTARNWRTVTGLLELADGA